MSTMIAHAAAVADAAAAYHTAHAVAQRNPAPGKGEQHEHQTT